MSSSACLVLGSPVGLRFIGFGLIQAGGSGTKEIASWDPILSLSHNWA